MTILDDTRALLAGQRDKLQAERDRLAGERDKITAQIGEVDALIRQLGGSQPTRTSAPTTGRRSGIRDQVLAVVQAGNTSPADIRKAVGIADGDKSGAGAVANALSALKRDGKVSMNKGAYTAAP
jgi:hypothetical protein